MEKIKVGDFWRSKINYPNAGYYVVEILELNFEKDMSKIKFYATAWEENHWTPGQQSISDILENYEKIA